MRNMIHFNLEEELKKLPDKPGVYLMHDKNDKIIYIGKAVSLTKRVHQYFQASHNEGIKKAQMVKQIARFEYIITDSELEALVLECNLIKEHCPKYNTMLRDDKTYPYIKVTLGESYPRVLFSRQMKKDKSKYFGPYTSAGAVKDTIELMQKLYHIRTCNRNLPKDAGKERPCLNYHIKQCDGPCIPNHVSEEEYRKSIDQALLFLEGKYEPILKMLEEKMQDASEKMEFEQAAEYRDLLSSVRQIAQKQKITSFDGEDKDVIGLATDGVDAVVQVFFIREGKLIGREHFYLRVRDENHTAQMLSIFLKQYYAGTPFLPKEIHLQEEIEDEEIICEWLSERRGSKVYLKVPQKGMKEKLVELAKKNAMQVLLQDRERIRREEGRTIGAMKEIQDILGMDYLERVEAFDISNISGVQSVGSMVVFEKGKAKKSDYRKFRLKTVSGPDDYASMHEVLTRRFQHGLEERKQLEGQDGEQFGSFTRFPDLIMMDGGRGQVNIACKVLEELHLDIPVCGMVKDDYHRTRGLYFHNQELPIDPHSEGFQLITRVQDEAHRFAIEYHRSLRSKEQVHSVLDDIPGIGSTRRKALMRRFRSIEAIQKASLTDLLTTESMSEKSAENVYEFFHGHIEE